MMTYLEVSGANIYHESVGQGPMLLCISGADGSCEIWRGFAECLKDHFTVVMWDRRGFSRSYLTGAQDYEHRLETDADDAARLIEQFSPQEPVTVIGNSSGAIISLKLLVRHPDLIRRLIPYEPPAAWFLSAADFDEHKAKHEEVYSLYRSSGMHPAFEEFAKLIKSDPRELAMLIDFRIPYMFSNMQYWFEREFPFYPFAEFSVEEELRPLKGKLLLVNGEMSPKGAYQYRANVELGQKLGIEVVEFPGAHVGHASHAKPFSEKLVEVLKAKDGFSKE